MLQYVHVFDISESSQSLNHIGLYSLLLPIVATSIMGLCCMPYRCLCSVQKISALYRLDIMMVHDLFHQ